MKKLKMLVMGMVVAMSVIATQAFAVTFPTADSHTLVSSDDKGVVEVKACGEKDWVLIQYDQDITRGSANLRITIRPFRVEGDKMWFQLDPEGVKDGQVAFNFRNTSLPGNPWLAIPDCRVKTAGSVSGGDSKFTSKDPESGGAMFVYTGSGASVQYPLYYTQWCDEGCSASEQSSTGSGVIVSNAPAVKVGKEGMGQTIVKSPDAQVTQGVGSINISAKGRNAKVKAAVISQGNAYGGPMKGPTVKHVKGNVCINNPQVQIVFGGGGTMPTECGVCHDQSFWNLWKDKVFNGFKGCTTAAPKKK